MKIKTEREEVGDMEGGRRGREGGKGRAKKTYVVKIRRKGRNGTRSECIREGRRT